MTKRLDARRSALSRAGIHGGANDAARVGYDDGTELALR